MSLLVEDGLNTSYIDTLLISLFYKSTHLYDMLSNIPENIKFAYLQDMIMSNFVEQIKRTYSIDISILNEIRNYSILCGWKDSPNMTDFFNVIDYLSFLSDGFNYGGISYELYYINKMQSYDIVASNTIKYINIKLEIDEDVTVKKLLDDWVDKKLLKYNDIHTYYKFKEIPMFIPIYFERLINECWNNCKIDFFKKIKFNSSEHEYSWIIHSLICITNKKYYSIINNDNKWYIFSNEKIPSLNEIDITNVDFANKIKQECILAIYRFDENT